MTLKLISHHLCPYVQRAVIALLEKDVPFERINIDLANKPDWFLKTSPLGKTPVLMTGETAIFESAVILEYLEDTQDPALHPTDPLHRAHHRAWIEFSSSILNDIAGLYSAPNPERFDLKRTEISSKFARLETELNGSDYFDETGFSLVDAAFAPVFRYFDTLDTLDSLKLLISSPKILHWRTSLAIRPSVQSAVSKDYPEKLLNFLLAHNAHLSKLLAAQDPIAERIDTHYL